MSLVMDKPFLSVIIPLYNKESYINDTIHSVLNQSFCDFEIVVVNDGSKDNSLEVVRRIDDSRIRVFNQENAGVSVARNRGMNEAQGEYLFFLDADDILLDGAFEICDELKNKNQGIEIYIASFLVKNSEGKIVKQKINTANGIVDDAYKALFQGNLHIRLGSIFVNRNIAMKVGSMRQDICLYEDTEWLYRLLENAIVYSSQKIILEYVRYDNGLSSKLPNVSKDFAGVVSLDGLYSEYRKKLIGDFIFRRLVVRIKRKDWNGVKTILSNNRIGIFYAMHCFILKTIVTKSLTR